MGSLYHIIMGNGHSKSSLEYPFFPTVNFNGINYKTASEQLRKYGVLVVEDIFDKETCDSYMDQTVGCLEKLCPVLDRNKIEETWKQENLPPNINGMYQSLISGSKPVWEMRKSKKLIELFQNMYF